MSERGRYAKRRNLSFSLALAVAATSLAVPTAAASFRPSAGGTLATRVQKCGSTQYGTDIRIVSYKYLNCATAQEVAARRAAGKALPAIAPGAAVRWRCSERGQPYGNSAFGSKLPAGYVECAGYRGAEFIRFKPVGSNARVTAVPGGKSAWRAVGLKYVEVMYVVRNGTRVRTLDSGGPYGESSCRSLNMTGNSGAGRAYGYGKPHRVRVTFARASGGLVVKVGGSNGYSLRYRRLPVANANRQLARQWRTTADGLLQKRFRDICR